MIKSSTETIIAALRAVVNDIESECREVPPCILEAAKLLEELSQKKTLRDELAIELFPAAEKEIATLFYSGERKERTPEEIHRIQVWPWRMAYTKADLAIEARSIGI